MKIYQGKSVFKGVAIGKILIYKKKCALVKRVHIENAEDEIKRFLKAKNIAVEQLKEIHDQTVKEVGEASADIFAVHQMMLEDLDYLESIENMINRQKINGEYAVATTADNFSKMFGNMEDAYMKERASDIKDISERVIRILSGQTGSEYSMTDPMIILADDLAPSETVQFDKSKVLAFVTIHGSTNSHTAILARTMNIPALISVPMDLADDLDGKLAIVDGSTGILYVEPDKEIQLKMMEKKEKEKEIRELLQTLRGKENVTLDGKGIEIYANIAAVEDVAAVLYNDAGGIGLFRSEFLYMQNDKFPTEEEQFQVYKMVAENMAGKKVIIRTLDIGADKQVDYFNLDKEENPAMGFRAIRICLERKEIFKTQLRALFRASNYGKIAIMYPMIISVDEVLEIKKVVEEVKLELMEQNLPFSEIEQGIMVETPAAVLISDLLAQEVDFFSIGTNDLTQFTLAIDRQNPKLDKIYDAHHPAIFRMIKMVVENAHAAGIWVGVCGELGADVSLTEMFLNIGVDELSVSPTSILELRKKIRETDLGKS